ncbi:MAG: LexA family transcriptional regulator [Thermoprotei archaeon]|nr:MAG: LexA family transcriptional regulator [Thermoprotei archaeon]
MHDLLEVMRTRLKDPLIVLSGTSLYVYLILLRENRPLGVREVQRLAGFKSPNSARHHLEKLVELGFAKKVLEGYVAIKPRSSLLSLFIFVRGLFLPRILFYAIFSTILLITYVVLRIGGSLDIYAIIFLAGINIILWADTVNLIRRGRILTRIIIGRRKELEYE